MVLLVSTQASGIINGTVDTDHPAVGVVSGGDSAMASAVLIDPFWVLTSATFAADCTEGWFLVGPDRAAPEATYAFSAIFPHPTYDPDTADNNIALIRLATPVVGVEPIPWLINGAAVQMGLPVQYVGYGMTSPYDESNTLRRSCVNTVAEMYPRLFITYYDGAGPCFGDAGGPALLLEGGVQKVAGLISHGDQDGYGFTAATRVSAFATFIEATIDGNPPAAVAMDPPGERILGAFPNPFNPSTEIAYRLQAPAEGSLTVYDLRGRSQAVLADGWFEAGPHTVNWDGRSATGRALASGTYLVMLRIGDRVETLKVELTR